MDYKTAYNKIIDAYFKDEIKPLSIEFCFCGTLANNPRWYFISGNERIESYTAKEYRKMETALFSGFNGNMHPQYQSYEANLFKGMCAALEVLKQIHIDRGEVIEEKQFSKRQLI